jgi:hypothetical protein
MVLATARLEPTNPRRLATTRRPRVWTELTLEQQQHVAHSVAVLVRPSLAADGVWLKVGVARYAFPVRLFHPLLSARLTGAFQDSIPDGWLGPVGVGIAPPG